MRNLLTSYGQVLTLLFGMLLWPATPVLSDELPAPDAGGLITVNVSAEGQFSSTYSSEDVRAAAPSATCLKIIGPLNNDDVARVKEAVSSTLTSLDLSEATVSSFANYAFSGCTELVSIDLPSGLTAISSFMFSECANLTTVNIPQGVQTIGYAAFERTGLIHVSLPATLTTSLSYTFQNCQKLTTAVIPEGITSISGVFYSCPNLKSVYLPSTLTSANSSQMFTVCSNLSDVHIKSTTCPIGSQTAGCANAVLYVPEGSLAAYQGDDKGFAKGWLAVAEEATSLTELDESEFQVLKTVCSNTAGTQWQHAWSLGATAAETTQVPYGVTVSGGHVVVLSLAGNKLQGTLPMGLFSSLPHLARLDLSCNQLQGNLSTLFNDMTSTNSSIEYLDLSNNRLQGNLYEITQKLSSLTELRVQGNCIRDIYPALPSSLTLEYGDQDLTSLWVVNYSDLYSIKLNSIDNLPSVLPTVLVYNHGNSSPYNQRVYFRMCNDQSALSTSNAYASSQSGVGATTWYGCLYWENRNYPMSITHWDADYANRDGWYQLPLPSNVYAGCYVYNNRTRENTYNRFVVTIDSEMGDVNFDSQFSLSDMQTTLNYALDSAWRNRYEPFNFTAANLAGNDEVINVQDVVASINMLLDRYANIVIPTSARNLSPAQPEEERADKAELFVDNGQLVLRSPVEVAALQLLLSDEGATQWQSSLSAFSHASRNHHHIFYSLLGDCLPAGTTVLANTEATVLGAAIVDGDGHSIPLSFAGAATGIQHVAAEQQHTERCFDLQGRRVIPRQPGIYIVEGKKVKK